MANEAVIRIRVQDDGTVAFRQLGKTGEQQLGRIETSAEKLSRATDRLRRIGGVALAGISASLTAVGVKSVQTSARFQAGFQEVNTLVNLSDRELEALKRRVLEIDPALGNTEELVAGLYQTISAGISEPKQSLGFLRDAARAAKAGVSNLEIAVTAGTKALAGYAAEGVTSTRVFDLMFTTVRLGQTRFEELAAVTGDLASLAPNLNIRIEEMFAGLAQLTLTAGSTSQAATQLEAVMTALFKPTEAMVGVIKKLGKDVGAETASQLIDKKGLVPVLQMLKAEVGDNEQKLGDLFGRKEALKGFSALAVNNFEGVRQKLDEMSDSTGAAAEAFEIQQKSYEASVDRLSNTFDRFKVIVGGPFLNTLSGVFDSVASGIDTFNRLPRPVQNAGVALGGILAVASGLGSAALLLLPRINATIAAMKTLGIVSATTNLSLKGVMLGLGKAGLVGAVAAASVALGSFINDRLNKADLTLGRLAEKLGLIQSTTEAVGEEMLEQSNNVDAFRQKQDFLFEVADRLREQFGDKLPPAIREAMKAGASMDEVLSLLGQEMTKDTDAGRRLAGIVNRVSEEMGEQRKAADEAADAVKNHGEATGDAEVQQTALQKRIDELRESSFPSYVDWLAETELGLRTTTSAALEFNDALGEQGDFVVGTLDDAERSFRNYISSVTGATDRQVAYLVSVGKSGDELINFADMLASSNPEVVKMAERMLGLRDATDAAGSAAGDAGGFFSGLFDSLKSSGKGLLEGIGLLDGEGNFGLDGLFSKLGGGIIDGLGNIISGGISSLISTGVGLITKGLGGLFDALFGGTTAEDIVAKLGFGDLSEGLVDEIQKLGEQLNDDFEAAFRLKLGDVIREQGAETTTELRKFSTEWRNILADVDRGTFSAAEGIEAMKDALPPLLDEIDKAGDPTAFIQVSAGLQDILSRTRDGQISVTQANDLLDESFDRVAESARTYGADGVRAVRQIILQSRAVPGEFEAISEFIRGQAEATVANVEKITSSGVASLNELDLAADALEFQYRELRDQGLGVVEASELLGEQTRATIAEFERLGVEAPPRLQEIADFYDLLADEKVAGLITKLEGVTGILIETAESGIPITEEAFDSLEQSIRSTSRQLEAQGLTGEQAMEAIRPQLIEAAQLAQQFGLEVDNNTKRLLEQAGIDLDLMPPDKVDVMIQGFEAIVGSVNRLTETMGGVPFEFEGWLDSTERAELAMERASFNGRETFQDLAREIGVSAEGAALVWDQNTNQITDDLDSLADLGRRRFLDLLIAAGASAREARRAWRKTRDETVGGSTILEIGDKGVAAFDRLREAGVASATDFRAEWTRSLTSAESEIVRRINGMASQLTNIPINFKVTGGGGVKLNLGDDGSVINFMPFAEGGIVDRPTLALIGEAGPEAVIPLKRDSDGALRVPDGGGGSTRVVRNEFHFHGTVVDEERTRQKVTEWVAEAMEEETGFHRKTL